MSYNTNILSLSRWKRFPNALDFTVMTVWVFISQLLVFGIATACGLEGPDMEAMHSADADISLWANIKAAQTLVIIYPAIMMLSIAGILLYRRIRGGRGRVARLSAEGLNPSLILAGFVWMISAQIVIEPLMSLLPPIPDTVGRGLFAILVTVIMAPLFEEFLCRGIILESFRAKYGVTVAWLCSSLFFAIIHGHITAMANALIMGAILGYICIRSRSLLSVVILHAMNNGLALTFMSMGLGDRSFFDLFADKRIYDSVYTAAVIVCLVGAASVVSRFLKEYRAEKAEREAATAGSEPESEKTNLDA